MRNNYRIALLVLMVAFFSGVLILIGARVSPLAPGQLEKDFQKTTDVSAPVSVGTAVAKVEQAERVEIGLEAADLDFALPETPLTLEDASLAMPFSAERLDRAAGSYEFNDAATKGERAVTLKPKFDFERGAMPELSGAEIKMRRDFDR